MYYIIKQPYQLRRWTNLSCGLVNPDNGTCYIIGENMWNILKCCDGSVDMQYVFMFPSQHKIFQVLLQRNFIVPAEKGDKLTELQKPKIIPFEYVQSIHWSITGKCNLRCKHCYMSAPVQKYKDLSLSEIEKIIKQMVDAEIHQVSLTGGEPLTRKDFWQIVEKLKAENIHIRQIYTNGLLVTDEFLERVQKENLQCEFVLSYDGKGMHDWLRGISGTEERTIEAIRRIKRHGYAVSIESALHSQNLSTLLPTYQLMKELHIDFWKCSYITNTGEWKCRNDVEELLQKDIYDAYNQLISINKEEGYPLNMHLDGYYACRNGLESSPYQEKGKENYSCSSCITQPYLLPDGRLIPCPSFTDTEIELSMPYLTEHSLTEIFQDKEGPFYQVTHIRGDEIKDHNESCHDCIHNDKCKGGCRAMALLSSGNLYGTDQMICDYYKLGYGTWAEGGKSYESIE